MLRILKNEAELFTVQVSKSSTKVHLFFFKATQSYIDSFGVSEEKNTDIGTWIKVPYLWDGDTLLFVIKHSFASVLNRGAVVVETRGYRGTRMDESIIMTTDITSEPSEVKPRQEISYYRLFRKDYAINKRR